jgi:hypothetical protein
LLPSFLNNVCITLLFVNCDFISLYIIDSNSKYNLYKLGF